MLDGCMYGSERTVYKTETINRKCRFPLGTKIKWMYTNCFGELKKSRNKDTGEWFEGKVVADYETYIILESIKGGYRYCIDKVDIATKNIRVKGFKPGIKKALAVEYRI